VSGLGCSCGLLGGVASGLCDGVRESRGGGWQRFVVVVSSVSVGLSGVILGGCPWGGSAGSRDVLVCEVGELGVVG
jgi:hypothetical protein